MAQRKKNENNETRQKLLDAAFDLFVQYGFDATTSRMIANKADVSLASISFYFGTKQALYDSMVDAIFESVSLTVDDLYNDIQAFLSDSESNDSRIESAWNYIQKLIEIQIETAFTNHRKKNILFVLREANLPHSERGELLINDLITKIEIPFAKLLLIITGKDDLEWAYTVSRIINGSIIGLGEHSSFLKLMIPEVNNQEIEHRIRSYVEQFIMSSIEAVVV